MTMDTTNTAVNVTEFSKYAVKQTLLATNALTQQGTAWKIQLQTNAIGIDANQTFVSADAAVDAVYSTLRTQFQKSVQAA